MLISNSKTQLLKSLFLMLSFLGIFIINGCDVNSNSTSTEEPEVTNIIISPDSVEIAEGEEIDFSAFVISASGDTINSEVDINWTWYSSNPDVFTVENGGLATGHNPGEAFCIVEANTATGKIAAKMVPIGLDSAVVRIF